VWRELKALLWLQWLLTRSMLRTHRVEDRLQAVRLLSRLAMLVMILPLFLLMGLALAVGLAMLPPVAARELAMITNVLLFGTWLLLPATYNSQLIERFDISQLFVHPIAFRTVVVGTALVSSLTMTGVWTVPLLVGEIAGLAWHQPLALPTIALGAVPVFALLVLTGRIMEDLFDLVAGDRRLRALALALLSLPFVFCWLGQMIVQQMTQETGQLPAFVQVPGLEELARIDQAKTPIDFVNRFGAFLEALRPSRLLVWTPPGWATAAMASAVGGTWWQGILLLAASVATVGLMLTIHAQVTRRLMAGAVLRTGPERVRHRQYRLRLPGPPAFWALFAKDWRYLWRSPATRRVLFSSLMMVVAAVLPLRGFRARDVAESWRDVAPLAAFLLAAAVTSMSTNMAITANHFGAFDRDGFASVVLSPVDRRYVLASANLSVLVLTLAQDLILALAIALLSGRWIVLPLGLFFGACVQVGIFPLCNLAAVLVPYRAQLKFTSGRRPGNLWGLAAWGVSALPVLAMVVLPYLFWRPGWAITLPLAVLYSGAVYVVTLRPLSRLLARREYAVAEAVSAGPT
jgi:hypothetical protein